MADGFEGDVAGTGAGIFGVMVRPIGLVLVVCLLCVSGDVRGEEKWPPPLPETPWFANAQYKGLQREWREDSVKKLSTSIMPAVVMVTAMMNGAVRSQGSGFFVNPEGYLVTNDHVVSVHEEVRVVLDDGRERLARVVARDPITDLAVLYVNKKQGERFAYVPLGDSSGVEVGDWAVAFGAPLRFKSTTTVGVVSSVNRKGSRPKKETPLKSYLQFDTAINPGSSGGPLMNTSGQVIGVVTAMRKDGQGLGFAIPVNRLKRVLPRLIGGQSVKASALGVDVQDMSVELGRSMGVQPTGALVSWVNRSGPAQKGGLKVGDVVTEYDGVLVYDGGGLKWLMAVSPAGREVSLSVNRVGSAKTLKLTPVLKGAISRKRKSSHLNGSGVKVVGGVGVAIASRPVKHALGYGDARGVLVVFVERGSPAFVAGLRPMMMIKQVDAKSVDSPLKFGDVMSRALKERGAVRILVHDREDVRWVAWEELSGISGGD